jgi:hypothetical protein
MSRCAQRRRPPPTKELRVKRLVRLAAAVTAGATLMVATAGVAVAKEVSNEKYAKQICGRISAFQEEASSFEGSSATDPAQFQQETVQAVEGFIAGLKAARTKLKKLSPEDGGKKVTKLFNAYFTEFMDGYQEALDKFSAADPNGVAFQGDVAIFTAAISTVDATISDPFSDLSDYQDLLGAFGDEKSCEDIVTVFGG